MRYSALAAKSPVTSQFAVQLSHLNSLVQRYSASGEVAELEVKVPQEVSSTFPAVASTLIPLAETRLAELDQPRASVQIVRLDPALAAAMEQPDAIEIAGDGHYQLNVTGGDAFDRQRELHQRLALVGALMKMLATTDISGGAADALAGGMKQISAPMQQVIKLGEQIADLLKTPELNIAALTQQTMQLAKLAETSPLPPMMQHIIATTVQEVRELPKIVPQVVAFRLPEVLAQQPDPIIVPTPVNEARAAPVAYVQPIMTQAAEPPRAEPVVVPSPVVAHSQPETMAQPAQLVTQDHKPEPVSAVPAVSAQPLAEAPAAPVRVAATPVTAEPETVIVRQTVQMQGAAPVVQIDRAVSPIPVASPPQIPVAPANASAVPVAVEPPVAQKLVSEPASVIAQPAPQAVEIAPVTVNPALQTTQVTHSLPSIPREVAQPVAPSPTVKADPHVLMVQDVKPPVEPIGGPRVFRREPDRNPLQLHDKQKDTPKYSGDGENSKPPVFHLPSHEEKKGPPPIFVVEPAKPPVIHEFKGGGGPPIDKQYRQVASGCTGPCTCPSCPLKAASKPAQPGHKL